METMQTPIRNVPLLSTINLSKVYTTGYYALNNLNLNLFPGRIVGLLGPNGSGKTTFIKLMNGLLTPTAGSVLINGKPVGRESHISVAYLPERTYLNSWMSVRQIINYFVDFYPNFNRDRAYEMLSRLGIQPQLKLKNLSKGTKEKIQLILVMSRDAELYVLDEPIAGVDPAARDYILNTILTNYNPSASVLISTHLIYDIERILDDVIFLRQGSVALAGAADDLRAQYNHSIDELFREVFRC